MGLHAKRSGLNPTQEYTGFVDPVRVLLDRKLSEARLLQNSNETMGNKTKTKQQTQQKELLRQSTQEYTRLPIRSMVCWTENIREPSKKFPREHGKKTTFNTKQHRKKSYDGVRIIMGDTLAGKYHCRVIMLISLGSRRQPSVIPGRYEHVKELRRLQRCNGSSLEKSKKTKQNNKHSKKELRRRQNNR